MLAVAVPDEPATLLSWPLMSGARGQHCVRPAPLTHRLLAKVPVKGWGRCGTAGQGAAVSVQTASTPPPLSGGRTESLRPDYFLWRRWRK